VTTIQEISKIPKMMSGLQHEKECMVCNVCATLQGFSFSSQEHLVVVKAMPNIINYLKDDL
jgi:hypothetical protein